MKYDDLGTRMKAYETQMRVALPRRSYTIVRLDGRAFHRYTRGLEKPFDLDLCAAMQHTTRELCARVAGCVLGYTQSDEISLVLTDFATPETQAFFDGDLQKIVSITASIATGRFNAIRSLQRSRTPNETDDESDRTAEFDSRAFAVPDRVEVANYLLWRQVDAVRNAVQMVAQTLYSPRRLHKIGISRQREMIAEAGTDFEGFPHYCRYGAFVIKEQYLGEGFNRKTGLTETALRSRWIMQEPTPLVGAPAGDAMLDQAVPQRDQAREPIVTSA